MKIKITMCTRGDHVNFTHDIKDDEEAMHKMISFLEGSNQKMFFVYDRSDQCWHGYNRKKILKVGFYK